MVISSQPASCRSLQRLADLLALLAHAEDQVRLGDQPGGAGRGDDVRASARSGTPGRIRLKMRGTVSTLCASTSGRAANTSASSSGIALKSGISSSTPVPGFSCVDLPHRLGVEPGAAVGAGRRGRRR